MSDDDIDDPDWDDLAEGTDPPEDGSAFDDLADAFVDASTDGETDDVWARLEGEAIEKPSDGTETSVVSKRDYCEQCRFLSDPPAFTCTHDGTRIVEFVDRDHVRVEDCPIVASRLEPEST